MIQWHNYLDKKGGGHSVAGNLKIAQAVRSPQLNNERDVLVHLPPSYESSHKQYPVLYMHDGQNLFDERTSYAGDWQVDETMQLLGREGIEAVVVGIPNNGVHRLDEYSPFRDGHHRGGRGDEYLAFIVNTLKPMIDRDFRTLPDRANTATIGSSMGGLISLYAFFRYPEVFGLAGVMSPALWFAGDAVLQYVSHAPFHPGRIYLDAGTRELSDPRNEYPPWRARSRSYYASVRRLKRILVRKGYRLFQDIWHVEEKWAGHQESAWGRRLAPALRFLITGAVPAKGTNGSSPK
jgi:predicted alpha/beta superfamily hydrolase